MNIIISKENAKDIESKLSSIDSFDEKVILLNNLLIFYTQQELFHDVCRVSETEVISSPIHYRIYLNALISIGDSEKAKAIIEDINPSILEDWDVKLQISRVHLQAKNFEESLRLSSELLDKRKSNPSASGIRIASLAHLCRFTELFDYIEGAEVLALSADWALYTLANKCGNLNGHVKERFFKAINHIAQGRGGDGPLWSIRLKRLSGYTEDARYELSRLEDSIQFNHQFKVELAYCLSDALDWQIGEGLYRELAFNTPGIEAGTKKHFEILLDRLNFIKINHKNNIDSMDYKYPDAIFEGQYASKVSITYEPVRGRIAMINGTLGGGGAEKIMATAYKELKQNSFFEPEMWLYSLNPNLKHDQVLKGFELSSHVGVSVFEMPHLKEEKTPPFNFLPQHLGDVAQRIYEFILLRRPEIIHAWEDSANLCAAFAAIQAGVPKIILHPHNMRADVVHQVKYVDSYKRAYKAVLSRPEVRLITVSKLAFTDYMEWTESKPSKRFKVIKNGHIWDDFPSESSISNIRKDFRKRNGLNEDTKIIGGIFRFNPVKRPNFWLDVASIFLAQHPDTRFVLFGDGTEFECAKAHAKRLGISDKVLFLGYVQNMNVNIFALDCLLHTSETEGCPNAIVEAGASGLPIVASNAGGVSECVDSDCSILLPIDGRPEDYSYALSIFLNESKNFAKQYRLAMKIRARFNLDRMMSKYLKVYFS